MKTPNECTSIEDIRAEIDRLDHQIIATIAERFAYVQAASHFKTSAAAVAAPERFARMLHQRRQWAENHHLHSDVIEKMYRDLVTYFISEEQKHWEANR